MEYILYVLWESRFNSIDVFTSEEDSHYIQYKKKWENKLSLKSWKLKELVWQYQYGGETFEVKVYKKTIDL